MDAIISGLIHLPLASLATAIASATTASPFMWYVTRAAATSSYITLTLLVTLGLIRSMTRLNGGRIGWWLDESHQFLALLTAILMGVHLLSLMLDALIPFSPLNIVLPFDEPYREIPVAIGVFSMYGLVVVLASSWLRQRIGQKLWRLIHYLTFACFAGVTLHGMLAGTDSNQPWMIFVYVCACITVSLLTLMRIFTRPAVAPARAGYVRRR